MDKGITLNHIESVRSLATSPICIHYVSVHTDTYSIYIYSIYIYIYIHIYLKIFLDIIYSNIYIYILICPLCFTTVCLTSVDQKASATAHLGWISLGKAAYDSGLNEDSVL